MNLAEESYLELVTSVPHVLFELTYEAITGVIWYLVINFIVRRFHKQIDAEHGVEHVVVKRTDDGK